MAECISGSGGVSRCPLCPVIRVIHAIHRNSSPGSRSITCCPVCHVIRVIHAIHTQCVSGLRCVSLKRVILIGPFICLRIILIRFPTYGQRISRCRSMSRDPVRPVIRIIHAFHTQRVSGYRSRDPVRPVIRIIHAIHSQRVSVHRSVGVIRIVPCPGRCIISIFCIIIE